MSRLQFVVADDHRMFAEALRLLLSPMGDVVARAESKAELLRCVHDHRPDVVITDVTMADGTGIEAIRELRRRGSTIPVILVTVHADELLEREAMAAGANGYVLKSAAFSELLEAITTVRGGARYRSPRSEDPQSSRSPLERLSKREREVLQQLAAGRAAHEIAELLGITRRTVEFHKDRMRERLGVATTVDAVNLYRSVSEA
jgi:DNA-binding NarL/FixJ family response regulator